MLLFLALPPGNYDGTGAPSVNYGWVLPNSSTTAEFSAACWFFAQELTDIAVDKNTTAPVIGLIQVRTDKRTLPSTPPKCGASSFSRAPRARAAARENDLAATKAKVNHQFLLESHPLPPLCTCTGSCAVALLR